MLNHRGSVMKRSWLFEVSFDRWGCNICQTAYFHQLESDFRIRFVEKYLSALSIRHNFVTYVITLLQWMYEGYDSTICILCTPFEVTIPVVRFYRTTQNIHQVAFLSFEEQYDLWIRSSP